MRKGSSKEKCIACGKSQNDPFHETQCKKCSEHHIKLHDLMCAFIIRKTRNKCSSQLVCVKNHNLISGTTKKPDILLNHNGKYYYLDIGFSYNVESYFKVKEVKYKAFDARVIPIIFGKDCTVHPEALQYLQKFGIVERELYIELGRLLGLHFEFCSRYIANCKIKDLPEGVSQ